MRIPPIKCVKMLALIALHAFVCVGSKAADDPRAAQLTFEPWRKLCVDRSYCVVGADARGGCVPSGGSVAVHVVDGKATKLGTIIGTRGPLDGDIRVQIDQGDQITIPAGPCYVSGCTGVLDIDDELVGRLRRSQRITIEATDTSHQKLNLSFSLAGFAQAFDGPGTEPRVIEEIISNEKMKARREQEEEQRKAHECTE